MPNNILLCISEVLGLFSVSKSTSRKIICYYSILLINLFTTNDFSRIGNDFKTIDNKNFRELFKKNNNLISSYTLQDLGLNQETINLLFNYVDNLIIDQDDDSYTLSNQLFEFIDRFIASEVVEIKNANPDDTAEIEFQKEEQGTHKACCLLKYIYDLNEMRKLANGTKTNSVTKKSIKDFSEVTWNRSSISLTGTHTHGVNSDAVLESNTSRVLAAVADGISRPALSPNRNDPLVSEYSSATAARAVIQALENFSPSLDSSKAISISEENPTKQKILKNPLEFLYKLKKIFNLLHHKNFTGNIDSQESDLPKNLRELIEKLREKSSNKDDLDALNDKDVLEHLTIAEAALCCDYNLTEVFSNKHKTKNLSAATTLSFALDFGDKISFVNIGDSPILIFDTEGKLLKSQGVSNSNVVRNAFATARDTNGRIYRDPNNFTLSSDEIFTIDKKQIGGFIIFSDGFMLKKQSIEDFATDITTTGNENFIKTKNEDAIISKIMQKTLESNSSLDDRSMQLVLKN